MSATTNTKCTRVVYSLHRTRQKYLSYPSFTDFLAKLDDNINAGRSIPPHLFKCHVNDKRHDHQPRAMNRARSGKIPASKSGLSLMQIAKHKPDPLPGYFQIAADGVDSRNSELGYLVHMGSVLIA